MLKISEGRNNDVSILKLEGNVIMGGPSVQLHDAVTGVTERGTKKILLDLGGVKYLDSSGIAELVNSMNSLSKSGGQLVLCNLPDRVTEVLTLSSLISVFETFDSEIEAIAALKES
jgi:anti-anti-sigma factor